jgi:predicted ATPase/signal transduction histidine kinase
MLTLSNYLLKEQLHQGEHVLVYRAIRQNDNESVILKILSADYPTPEDVARLKHEYDLLHNMNSPLSQREVGGDFSSNTMEGIIKVFGLEQQDNRYFIVLEDFGGESIANFLEFYFFETTDFLRIALSLVDIIDELHRQNVIHKDINPSNILWNPNTQQIKLIDFGISTQLPRENPTLSDVNSLEGTLAYMAPEQTGRMNRAMDYRTDFYSLGATFYQMLTRKLPFETDEAMEMVHCHLAKTPIAPDEINPKIPPVISQIVLKLMAKNAEDRYQSAFGLKADLEFCRENLQRFKNLEGFSLKLGQYDFSEKFQIPQKLYGRENEIKTYLSAFERVSQEKGERRKEKGKPEMMLIAGYSGIGKSALVKEIYKNLTEKNGFFISGKFDQFQRNVPYSAIVSAFSDLVRQLLTESAEQLQTWKEKILSLLGNNAQLIIDVIPEIEFIIGKQPPIPELGLTESQNRFNLVFQNFICLFAQQEHPLVIFLDDLQWADSATLKLIELMMTNEELNFFFLIGAYRDNEVSTAHSLSITLAKLQKEAVTIHQITLGPLTLEHLTQLIADTLHSDRQTVQPLAELVTRKTGGNPFFVNQFLKTLYDEKLLSLKSPLTSLYESGEKRSLIPPFEKGGLGGISVLRWQWDIAKIEALNITDNVVDLMIGQLQKLPEATQQVLRLAACIGNRFELNTLSLIAEQSITEISEHLQPALQEGLVQNTGKKTIKNSNFQNQTNSQFPIPNYQFPITHYQFLHDRVQQAAYTLIPDEQKPTLHLKIGRLLWKNTSDESLSENLFEIVDHLNLGLALVTSPVEKEEIARLNLKAGQKAKAATAYEAAVKYLDTGLKQLSSDCWEKQYDLTLALYEEIVEAEFLSTHFEQARTLSQKVLQHTKTILEQIKIYEVLIQLNMAQNNMQAALDNALQGLEMLGISLKKEPPEQLKVEDCYDLPEMTQPEKLAAMRLLIFSISPAYTIAPELFPVVTFTMVELSVKYGNSALAAYAYANYSSVLCSVLGKIDSGYQFGQLALHLLNQFKVKKFKVKVLTSIHVVTNHWKQLARNNLAPLLETVKNGMEVGDLEYVGIAAMHCASYYFWVGESLELVAQKQKILHQLLNSFKQEYQLVYLKIWQQTVFNLQGRNSEPCRLIGEVLDEDEILPNVLEINYGMAIFGIYLSKSMLCYLFKDYAQSVANAALAEKYEQANVGIMVVPVHKYYYSLALLATYPTISTDKQSEIIRQVDSYQQQMKTWAFHAPTNYQHKYDLVEAEKARVLGKKWEAAELYEKAIAGARENQYLHEEALAYELAAEFYLAQGMDKFAQTYFKEAHYRYQQWGAQTKVEDLEQRYPQFLAQISESTLIETLRSTNTVLATRRISTTGSGRLSLLDLETVMKASQTIAGDVQLDKLLVHLMNIIIENAGAEKGFLLLEKHGQWLVEAEGTTNQQEIQVLQSVPITKNFRGNGDGWIFLPGAIINYVGRTQEPVSLNDATHEGEFTQTPYIIAQKPKSILCIPLINQGKLSGIVYLENNLATGAFTPKRVETVQLLGSQAAISLDNARLYEELAEYNRTLEAKVAERTQELSQALNHLKTTQQELVQSEKMAALGQLVAGIAHEINTPLGAIRASISNIVDGLNESVQQLPQLLQKLSLEQQRDFFALSETALKHKKNLTSREERKIRRKIRSQLEDYEIENTDDMADTLVDMGIYENIEAFVSLFQSQHHALILKIAYHLTMQQIHSQNILTAVERASKVVFALKSYARYDDESEMVNAKITDGIDVVLTLYYNQLKHGVEVTTHYQEIPEILCYPDELNQVWTNLIHNAIQAMDNKGSLNITVTEIDHQIRVQITDSGKGIPDEIKPRIFEPFFTTKPAGEGSGLGLDIVKKIIDKHHGKIEVASQPGDTTFSIDLPKQQA